VCLFVGWLIALCGFSVELVCVVCFFVLLYGDGQGNLRNLETRKNIWRPEPHLEVQGMIRIYRMSPESRKDFE
jgi:hypothetical protein